MAKQIYIDENGNEIQVSGTINTAELLPISGNDPTDTKSYIDSAISALENYSLTDYSTNIASNWNVITSSGCYAMKIGNVGIITIRIKTSASISSGSLTLSTLPFASPREIWGSLSSLDNKGGFIQLNGKELLIRCSASSDNFLAGQVVVPIST